ncbi:MAG: two component transcriptional regulator, winged helix family [Myxococcaceae bacterium]|nr:two component transcriptional regulator, winged helix family [Myxococcaceae bacterium]
MNPDGPLVLIVEDEAPVRLFIRASLAAHGFRPIEATTEPEALAMTDRHRPTLILLDLDLPAAQGVELVRTLRGSTKAPILVISARGQEDDKVAALDAGADDYVTKPFGVNELLARMRVALRYATTIDEPRKATAALSFGGLRIDLEQREVTSGGRAIRLTPTEYRLLVLLAQNAGRVLTHRQIQEGVWGAGHADQPHRVRVYMAVLRKKLEDDPAWPRHIVTEQGIGYRFREASSA